MDKNVFPPDYREVIDNKAIMYELKCPTGIYPVHVVDKWCPEYAPDDERSEDDKIRDFRLAKNYFIVHFAQLIICPFGNLRTLAEYLELPYSTLTACYSRFHGVISPALAVKISDAVKERNDNHIDLLPLAYIRPDIFKA